MKIRRVSAVLALLVLGALVIAGCGGGSSSSSESTSGSSESAAESPEATSEGSTSASLSGEPYVIGGLTPTSGEGFNYPQWNAGGVAAAEAINAEGGIQGHPVEYVNCNDKNNPNEASKCAHEMVGNRVIGVAGGASLFHENVDPILKEANVPWVGPFAESAEEYNDENIFLLNGSDVTQGSSIAYAFKLAGLKTTGFGVLEIPGTNIQEESMEIASKHLGMTPKGKVSYPITATDMSPFVQQMIEQGPEGVAIFATEAQCVNFLKTATQLGANFTFGFNDGAITPENYKAIENLNAYVIGGLPPVTAGETDPKQFPGVVEFREDMKTAAENGEKYASEQYLSYFTLDTWLATKVIAQVANEIKGEVTAEAVTAALNAAKDIETGVFPPWTPGAPGPANFTRVSNPWTYVSKIEPDGLPKLVVEEPVNIIKEVPVTWGG